MRGWLERVVVLAAWGVLGGCGPQVGVDDDGGDSGDGSTGTSGSASVGTSVTTSQSDTGTGTTTVGSVTDVSVSASATVGTVTTDPTIMSVTDPTVSGPGELPNGAQCSDGSECISGHCYVLELLGGICGECEGDADCEGGGCTLPNPLADPPQGSVCNTGGYAAGCESDAACQDPYVCAQVIEVPGIIEVSTCGECIDDGDCAQGWLCAPDIAVLALAGVNRCVAPGTLANGQSCDHETSGDASCQSGHCAPADLMGLLFIGVCSACESDAECMPLTCTPPVVDLQVGLVPGSCE